eukprot:gnl/MRDRNA2_/MRDRNA2_37844_c0_seq1.p1 gnl/MRDRNA2_/MRDRNA2_37844_c0~~gnl/MRDRNA2_/MRDRNA2_37844_c0_seq1.p1  ORF type:complete len:312 (+),score=5.38 gnl/MRDRNA2_/MRDRNA2_37844_c0_seq1:133-1068(+)
MKRSYPGHFEHFLKYIVPFRNRIQDILDIQIYSKWVDVVFIHAFSHENMFASNDPEKMWLNMTGLDLKLCPLHWEGIRIPIPCDTEACIAAFSGSDWRKPKKQGVNPRDRNFIEEPLSHRIPQWHLAGYTCFLVGCAASLASATSNAIQLILSFFISLACRTHDPRYRMYLFAMAPWLLSATMIFWTYFGWPSIFYYRVTDGVYVSLLCRTVGSLFLQMLIGFGSVELLERTQLGSNKAGNDVQDKHRPRLTKAYRLTIVVATFLSAFWDLYSLEHYRTIAVSAFSCIVTHIRVRTRIARQIAQRRLIHVG